MKNRIRMSIRPVGDQEHPQDVAEAAEFHYKRLNRELKIETKKASPSRPEGNYEYEQLVAEEANFNTKPMIEEAAFYLSERREFAPGGELSDWLQAENDIEGMLRRTQRFSQ